MRTACVTGLRLRVSTGIVTWRWIVPYFDSALNTAFSQNYYAQNQKQNPHTPKVMVSLGLSEDDVTHFVQHCLFPELK